MRIESSGRDGICREFEDAEEFIKYEGMKSSKIKAISIESEYHCSREIQVELTDDNDFLATDDPVQITIAVEDNSDKLHGVERKPLNVLKICGPGMLDYQNTEFCS